MFDDRIEVRSPGLPPQPVTVEDLNRRRYLHVSRNPLIVRILAELGYMRELGEGIPRMFDVMQREGFYPPRFDSIGGASFQVTLRNQPIYDPTTLEWLRQFADLDLSGDQKRLLAYARAHGGTFTSRDYQKLVGIDLYGASNSIKVLIRKSVVRSTGKGSRIYEVVQGSVATEPLPQELGQVLSRFRSVDALTNEQVRSALGISRASATRYLRRWVESGWLRPAGTGRGRRYELTAQLNASPPHDSDAS